MSFLLKTEI